MSYIDIPLTNEYIFFELIDHQTGIPLVNPQFPIGIGMNFGTLYDLGCGIKIHKILSIYELCFSEVFSVTLCLYGTTSVGDMDVYSTSGAISDSPITPTNFNYEIPLEDTYDSTYCGYLFKMSTPSAISYSTFINTGSYIRIEYNALESIYISNVPKRRYFNTERLDLTNLEIKAVLSNNTEEVITNYTSSIANDTVLSPSNTSVTFSYTRKLRTRTCTLQIEVVLWGSESLNVAYAGVNSDPNQVFDIYIPSGSPPQNGFPTIVTIHGGSFLEGSDKSAYDYITPFIINNGCIHVNMNYRLMPENPSDRNTSIVYYQLMLNDIYLLLEYLYDSRKTSSNLDGFPIDTSNIYLMGYSAGGYLALLYSYKLNNASILINGVISEAGPTFFDLSNVDEIISSLCGLTSSDSYNVINEKLQNASPFNFANDSISKTILIYSRNDQLVSIKNGCKMYTKIYDNTWCNGCTECIIQTSSNNSKSIFVINNLSHSDIGHLIDFNNNTHSDVQAYYIALSNFLNNNS